jgi:hypothetical protein
MIGIMIFVLWIMGILMKSLFLPSYLRCERGQKVNLYSNKYKMFHSQYSKKITIWILGENKFT